MTIRKKAHWIDFDLYCNGSKLYQCSNCDGYTEVSIKIPKYCQWCGAKMIELEEYERNCKNV